MGEFELRLLPWQGYDVDDFELDQRHYTASANRPVQSGEELLAVAYLDPRVRYDVEIVLKAREGEGEGERGIDVAGVAFASYIRRTEYVLEGNWYSRWNEERAESGAMGRKAGWVAVMVVSVSTECA